MTDATTNSLTEAALAEIENLFGLIRPGAFAEKQAANTPQEGSIGSGNINPAGWVVNSSDTVTIDESGITIVDGALNVTNASGATTIVGGDIATGSITADKLSTILLLTSLLKTAVDGARIEIDSAGIRCYDADELLVFNLPSNGDPVFFKGVVQAESFVSATASLEGATAVAASSTVTVASSQANPPQAPVVVELGWVQEDMPANGTYDLTSSAYNRVGLEFDPNAGAGGTTDVFWTFALGSSGSTWNLLELLASDNTVNRAVALTSGYTPLGVARLGSYVYVLYTYDVDPGPGTTLGSAVNRYLVSDLTLNATYASVNMPVAFNSPRIASDGTNLFIIDRLSSGNLKWNKYDGVLAKQGSTIDTGYNPGENANDAAAGNFDFGAWRLLVAMAWDNDFETLYDVISFDSAGAIVNNDQFPTSPSSGDRGAGGFTYGNANAIGARIYSFPNRSADQSVVSMQRHSLTNWSSASSIFWAAYTWYDSVGTTHETQVGPRGSATIRRRTYISVTAAVIPGGGGADEPNQHRYYVKQNATDPGATGLYLQQTSVANAITIDTYNASGAADPGSNGFSALGANAEIRSQVAVGSGGWSLKGDGRIAMGGTAFPGSPATNDQFFRTDLGLEFYYDGTRWLSKTLYMQPLTGPDVAGMPISVSTSTSRMGVGSGAFGLDTWGIYLHSVFYVAGGTALSGSHKWVSAFDKVSVNNVNTNLATVTINSGASSIWRAELTAVSNVIDKDDHYGLQNVWTKTGTPGNLYFAQTFAYRMIGV